MHLQTVKVQGYLEKCYSILPRNCSLGKIVEYVIVNYKRIPDKIGITKRYKVHAKGISKQFIPAKLGGEIKKGFIAEAPLNWVCGIMVVSEAEHGERLVQCQLCESTGSITNMQMY